MSNRETLFWVLLTDSEPFQTPAGRSGMAYTAGEWLEVFQAPDGSFGYCIHGVSEDGAAFETDDVEGFTSVQDVLEYVLGDVKLLGYESGLPVSVEAAVLHGGEYRYRKLCPVPTWAEKVEKVLDLAFRLQLPKYWKTDLLHDARLLRETDADVFVWAVRETGTWTLTPDQPRDWLEHVVKYHLHDSRFFLFTSKNGWEPVEVTPEEALEWLLQEKGR